MYLNRQVRDIPDGDPVPGASMQITRATDSVSVGSAVTDADGFATLTANGSPGPIKARFLKGSTIWSDDSRSLMAVGSHSLAELRDLINYTHTDGYLPWGNQFSATTGINTFTVSTGAVVLDGVVAIHWSASTVATTDGDIAIVIRQANADGRTELAAIAYADIGSVTCVPLWRCTVTSGSASNIVWIGTRTLIGINNYHKIQFDNVRASSGSTTNASGEASAITTTLTLETGVHYQVTAKASFIARARDGAIAISINGNLSTYRTNSGDVQVTLRNSHVRDVTGAGACVVTVYHRSDTALTDWILLGTFCTFGSGNDNLSSPGQVAVDTSGYVYIADTGNSRMVKRDSSGDYVGSITGLTSILGVAVDISGNIYTAHGTGTASRVRKYNSSFVQQWEQSTFGSTSTPRHLATDGTSLFFTNARDVTNKLTCAAGVAGSPAGWGVTGSANGEFNAPWGVAYFNSEVYVVDAANSRVQVFSLSGVYQRQWSIPANSRGIAADASGDLWIAVNGSNELRQYSNTGTLLTTLSQATPYGVGIASGDILWVSNAGGHSIAKWDETAAAFNYDAAMLSVIAIPRT